MKKLPKLIVILGPTASGKTSWSLRLAKKYNGEIISADSRQIYKKMDIGTAKPVGEWRRDGLRKTFYVEDIPHHLVDFLDPGKRFTVAEFRDNALKFAKLAYKAGRVPFLVGGTGLYVSSVVDNFSIPRVKENKKLRKSLESKSNEELVKLLGHMDKDAAMAIDTKNTRRIIRALEVCILTGEPFSKQRLKGEPLFDVLQIAPQVERSVLHQRISDRIDEMVKDGLLDEVKGLLRQKYHWKLSSMQGIGYRQFRSYLESDIDLTEAIEHLKRDTRRFARRQLTWFRRDKRIRWCERYDVADRLVEEFLQD